jgi:haloalkane dehalogenase
MPNTDLPAVIEHEVLTAKGRVHVNEYPGEGSVIVLTHGFPDDSRIYNRLLPELAGRRTVTFDFLGHGRSGREALWPLGSGQREGELAAVVDAPDAAHWPQRDQPAATAAVIAGI